MVMGRGIHNQIDYKTSWIVSRLLKIDRLETALMMVKKRRTA
jgi:hypothetical protein